MQPKTKYTYENAGFSSFLLRSLKSNPGAQTVRGGISMGSGDAIQFDRQAIGGSMADAVKMGRLVFDGLNGRIKVLDKTQTTETGWMGDLTNN